MKTAILMLTAVLGVAVVPTARAEDPLLLGSDELDLSYSEATRGIERPQDALGFLVVVYEREFEERGYRTLADLLADVPGFWLERDEQGSVVFTRGLAQSILIVYDGVPLIFDTGRSELNVGEEISLLGVRSVEVLRGPGTALWGPNAFNGIVYIRTKDAMDLGAARLIADVGSNERVGLGGEIAFLPPRFSIYATARFLRDRGPRRFFLNTPSRYVFLGGGLSVPVSFQDGAGNRDASMYAEALVKARWRQAHLEVRYSDFIRNSPLSSHSHSLLESGRNERQRAPTLLIKGGNRWAWRELVTARTDLFFLARGRNDRFTLYRQDPSSEHLHGGQITLRGGEFHLGVSAQANLRLSIHTLTAGLQASINKSELVTDFIDPRTGTLSRGAVARNLTNTVVSLFAQDRIKVGRARFTFGGSLESQSDFTPSFNPRAGTVVQLGRGWIAKAQYGEGIRTPDLFDVVGISGGAASGDVVGVAANPDLKSEKIRTGGIGVEYRRGTLAWGSAGAYVSSIEGLIQQEATAGVVRAVNGPRRYSGGLELAGQLRPLRELRMHASYTLSRLIDADGTPFDSAPLHFGSAGMGYDLYPWLTLYGAVHGATERHTADADYGDGQFGTYFTLDARVIVRPTSWPVTFALGVENALNTQYDHRNPAVSGRNLAVPIPADPVAAYLTVEGRF